MTKFINFFYVYLIKFLLRYGLDKQNTKVLDLITSDLYRYTGSHDKRKIYDLIKKDTGFKFSFFLRIASIKPKSFFSRRVHALSYNFHKRYFLSYGYQIPINTKIGKGLHLLHFGNIVINSAATIGENCTIAQGALIGQINRGVPTIGNKVWIGANSILVGNITIGSNVLIAPGSFINVDVPDNSLVIGNPCKIHPKTSAIINGYIVNT